MKWTGRWSLTLARKPRVASRSACTGILFTPLISCAGDDIVLLQIMIFVTNKDGRINLTICVFYFNKMQVNHTRNDGDDFVPKMRKIPQLNHSHLITPQ